MHLCFLFSLPQIYYIKLKTVLSDFRKLFQGQLTPKSIIFDVTKEYFWLISSSIIYPDIRQEEYRCQMSFLRNFDHFIPWLFGFIWGILF